MKRCNRCGKEKPLDDYYRSPRSKDGHRSVCKQCDAEHNKAYRLAHGMKPRSESKKAVAQRLGVKECIQCRETLPLEQFWSNQSVCKNCRNEHRLELARAKGVLPRNHEQLMAQKNGFIVCKKCGLKKGLGKFELRPDTGNYRLTCNECRRKYHQDYYGDHKDDQSFIENRKNYYLEHAEEAKARSRKHYNDNKEHHLMLSKQWTEAHSEEVKEYKRQYRIENKEHIREITRAYWAKPENRERKRLKSREYQSQERVKQHRKEYQHSRMGRILDLQRERMKNDPLYRMKVRIGKLVGVSLRQRGYSKNTRTFKIIGLQYDELWDYLQKTWHENYGVEYNDEPYEIDHIHPLSDAKNENELLELWSYRNLQLLTPEDNADKLDKLDWIPPKSSKAHGRMMTKGGKRILLP